MMTFLESKILKMQTRQGSDIENEQFQTYSSFERNNFAGYDREYRPIQQVVFRGEPTPIYNCHGMVFASRRTGIFSSQEVSRIIKEDGFVEIDRQNVLPGDVVLYFDESGDIEHSAIIIGISRIDSVNMPNLVFSKWGKFKEVIHPIATCPYSASNLRFYRIEK